MTAGMGLLYSLFASLLLVWPSERARRLVDFGPAHLGSATAALVGWTLSSLALIVVPLAAAFAVMTFYPDALVAWRWAGIGVMFWLATAGKLAPSVAYRPYAANDNQPVKGIFRVALDTALQGYSWRLGLIMASVLPQFLDSDRAPLPQILFAVLLFAGLTLLAAAFYGLFPKKAHAFLNVIPERRKAMKTGLNGYRQHGQTRISYRRKAA